MMATLTMRPYQGTNDLQAIAHLFNTISDVDCLDHYTTPDNLERSFDSPNFDKDKNLRLWEDADHQLIGVGSLWVPAVELNPLDAHIGFAVRPENRYQGLEHDMLTWAETRLREIGAERGVAVELRAGSRDRLSDRIAFLTSQGFENDRCFHTMTRSLDNPISSPQLPSGFSIEPVGDRADAWIEAFNQSFIDHWNHHPITLEQYQHWLQNPNYEPDLDLVAVAPDGTIAAFCEAATDVEFNRRTGDRRGWINVLGTRRGFRRQGLGRAMLLAGLQGLQRQGLITAKLGVDTQNPNQAFTLYESVGFCKDYASLSFVKKL